MKYELVLTGKLKKGLKLANVFFKSVMIEAWGRSFEKIREACNEYLGPLPEYDITEAGIMVLCRPCDKYMELLRGDGQNHDQIGYVCRETKL